MFKRKAYDKLLDWKNNYAPNYACLLEGERITDYCDEERYWKNRLAV